MYKCFFLKKLGLGIRLQANVFVKYMTNVWWNVEDTACTRHVLIELLNYCYSIYNLLHQCLFPNFGCSMKSLLILWLTKNTNIYGDVFYKTLAFPNEYFQSQTKTVNT